LSTPQNLGPLVPPNIEELIPYQPGKPIEELERELGIKNPIKLASNENPLGVSPKALAAASEAILSSNRYPDGGGFRLRSAIARKYGLDREEVVLGNGSVDLIDLLVRAFLGPDDEALLSRHSFMSYSIALQTAGRRFSEVPPREYRYDLEAMRRAVTPATKLVFVANPDNPSGTYVSRAFARAEDYPDGLSFWGQVPRLVILRTFAKAHGLAGLRVGYALTDRIIAGYLNRVRLPFNVSLVAQRAAEAAIDDDEFVRRSRHYCAEALDVLTRGLQALGVPVVPSQTNFVLIEVPRDGVEVYQSLLREGVIVRPLAAYGYKRHLRVSIGLPEENQRFLAALAKVLGRSTE
jgi:histidinol-phosphate aminotransferase